MQPVVASAVRATAAIRRISIGRSARWFGSMPVREWWNYGGGSAGAYGFSVVEGVLDAVASLAAQCLPGGSERPLVAVVGHRGTTEVFRACRGGRTVFVRLAEAGGGGVGGVADSH